VLDLPSTLPDGLQTVAANDETWRILVKPMDGGVRVAIGQPTSLRDEIARNGALRTVLPLMVLVPVLLILVHGLIRRMFKPVKQLALELDQLSEHDLRALDFAHVPSEIHPFAVAINRLLSRVVQSMALQRRFLADAAHELRSPLTALSLQSERLAATELPEQARLRVRALQSGLQRSRQLLDQLLTLARAQDAGKSAAQQVPLRRVCHRVLEDLMPLAQAKDLDLGMLPGAAEQAALVLADEIDLYVVVKNLVDNAIRYTPAGGRVDVLISEQVGQAVLQIDDSGPGIAEDELQRVFDPFYRILGSDEIGSGLGLSIAKTIIERIGARIILANAQGAGQSGLRVRVEFPVAVAGPSSAAHHTA
jgi:two-component system OmpR family sensor kinase